MANMNKIKIGITGQSGFVGTHLYNELGLFPEKFERILFEDSYFADTGLLTAFVKQCDVIVHLAAVNRHPDEAKLFEINVGLVNSLINVLMQENIKPHIIFSSSTQERLDNLYGKSKREGCRLFEKWAKKQQASFTGMIIPNVYGPFGLPNYNSFIATFCYKLTHNEKPVIANDNEVRLIYVSSLCKHILSDIENTHNSKNPIVKENEIPSDFCKKVSEILSILEMFKEQYYDKGYIPVLNDENEINLFNTFRSFIDLKQYYPRFLQQHSDARGSFVETIRLGVGGQVSFSTTKQGIIRGNHFHTRKIERFTVIKGQAKIQLRKIGTDTVFEYYLNGSEPSYVDMPVWYTHNLINVGTEDLYTQFWINEWYDENNPDTYFEQV
jgi:UDP-2-acetamido-2,6-beta-L-arabino-hexul-4-ose reductase